MTEFSALFRACWVGESPWQAIADWILEHPERPLKARHTFEGSNDRVYLSILTPAGLPTVIAAYLEDESRGTTEGLHFMADTFAAGFVGWVANEQRIIELKQNKRK